MRNEAREKGNAFFHKGDFDAAIAAYTEAIQFDPTDAKAYCGRASAYTKKGNSRQGHRRWHGGHSARSKGTLGPTVFGDGPMAGKVTTTKPSLTAPRPFGLPRHFFKPTAIGA